MTLQSTFYAFPNAASMTEKTAATFRERKIMTNAEKPNQQARKTARAGQSKEADGKWRAPSERLASSNIPRASELDAGTTSTGALYGYARVSARDQNLARQLDALQQFGVPPANIFTDHASGKDFERPAWRQLIGMLAPGDVLVVKSIDRFGRNYDEIQDEWRRIVKACGAAVVVLDMPLLDTRRERDGITGVLIADIVLQLLSYVAQIERESIHQRQAEGIAAAQARGVRFGRPSKQRMALFEDAKRSYLNGCITRHEAAARLEVSVSTFDRWMRRDREREG